MNLIVSLLLLAILSEMKADTGLDHTKDKSCGKECGVDCYKLPFTKACGTNFASYTNRCVLECDACNAKDGNKFRYEGDCVFTDAEMDMLEKERGWTFDREDEQKRRKEKEERDKAQTQ